MVESLQYAAVAKEVFEQKSLRLVMVAGWTVGHDVVCYAIALPHKFAHVVFLTAVETNAPGADLSFTERGSRLLLLVYVHACRRCFADCCVSVQTSCRQQSVKAMPLFVQL